MAKNVFRADEILYQSRKVFIKPPQVEVEEAPEEVESLEEFDGTAVEDLRREADEFKANWEQEKARLIQVARDEAEKIKKEAERAAFDEVKRKNNQAQKIRQEAEDEAKRIVREIELPFMEVGIKVGWWRSLKAAMDLLARHLVDQRASVDLFGSCTRLQRDLMSDGAREYLAELLPE